MIKKSVAMMVILIAVVGAAAIASAETRHVTPGSDLQAALNQARAGDRILLAAGATFVGNFVLPMHSGDEDVVLTTDLGDDSSPPQPGQRVTPEQAAAFAKLRSPSSLPVLSTQPGAHHWRIELLEFLPSAAASGNLIELGDGDSTQHALAQVPHDLTIDRCYLHGDPQRGQKRGIALNSASTTIRGSHLSDFKYRDEDSQAIAGWNGPGPFLIENNYLEAESENVLFGGADPWINGLIPSDITVRGNLMSRPVGWRSEKLPVKNLFELKNARRVLVEKNVFENNWSGGQSGFAIVFTPRNQDGRAPWSTVQDVTFRMNAVRHSGSAINILGQDNERPSAVARGIRIEQNVFFDIDSRTWGGDGVFLQIGDGPDAVTVEHNTIIQSGTLISVYGGSRERPVGVPGFVFTDNLALHNRYGVHGQDRATGTDTISAFFPGAVFLCNVLAGGRASEYPGGNLFPSVEQFRAQFVDFAGGDYRLKPDSIFRGAACDGTDLGADVAKAPRTPDELRDHSVSPRDRPGGGSARLRSCTSRLPECRPSRPSEVTR
jgi:hypothetical protein